MKPLFFALATAALATSLTAHARIERVITRTFPASASGTLSLETSGGLVAVTPGAGGVVTITAREKIRADSEEEADKLLKDLDLTFEQNGADVHAAAKYQRRPAFHFGPTPVVVDLVATVPSSYAAKLHTSGGNVTVGDLEGAVSVRTSGGGVKLGKLGGRVDAHTSGGSIALAEGRGEVKLGSSGGNIQVGRVAGPADLSTSGGSITIAQVKERLHAHTSGGNIRAALVGPLKGDCSLSTSGGSVHVTVDKAAAFHLNASTSGGAVDARGLTITRESSNRNRTKLVGLVNGGGPELNLRTSGGNVDVVTR